MAANLKLVKKLRNQNVWKIFPKPSNLILLKIFEETNPLVKNFQINGIDIKQNVLNQVRLQWPPAFKSQRVGYQSSHCIYISIQNNSSIHKFIIKIQQILGSYELKGHGHDQLLALLNLY